jgi:hypothetical protein
LRGGAEDNLIYTGSSSLLLLEIFRYTKLGVSGYISLGLGRSNPLSFFPFFRNCTYCVEPLLERPDFRFL